MPAMKDMMVKIMVEVLDILGTATQEMKQSRAKKFLKRITGITKLEDGLNKLDKMTNEEARLANAEVMKLAHGIHMKVERVDERVQGVNENVKVVEGKVQSVIDDGKKAVIEAQMIMQRTAYDVGDVKRWQLREGLRKWQSPSDPSTNHNFASDRQHEGTAEWFCKGGSFEKWKVTGSLLWIHGKPGSGKSILCSAIINDIENLHTAGLASLAYFYFDFRDVGKQSRGDLLRSLLIQLSSRSDTFCDILPRLYDKYGRGTLQPSDSNLMDCLKEMLTLPDQCPVYLIMDALDECPNTTGIPSVRELVLDLVKYLVNLRIPSLRICVTSRPEVNILYALDGLAFFSVSLHDESGQKKDIDEYIKSVVHSPSDTLMKRWREDDKDHVIQTLSERADGMFRWVFCQLETLRHCLPQNVPHTLTQLPATLDETYARMLKEIGKTNEVYAYRLLQCLTVAQRPLLVNELSEILALDFEAEEGIPVLRENWRWKDQEEAVLSTCSSLVSVVNNDSNGIVQFSHFSVKEFLTSDRLATLGADISRFHILPKPAHTVIVKACLGLILQSGHVADRAEAFRISLLFDYADEHWPYHARFEDVWTIVEDGIRRLFDPTKPHLKAWLKRKAFSVFSRFGDDYDLSKPRGSPLYYASQCGLHDLAAQLVVENPQQATGLAGLSPSPLGAALCNRNFDIAEMLCQYGADLSIRGYDNTTLLHVASRAGFVDLAMWLFNHGVPEKVRPDNHETPLHSVKGNGHKKHGITVDVADDNNNTPLHWASQGGHVEIMRQLLWRGADVTKKDRIHRTPLHLASKVGKAETVELLIEHGADVTAQDRRHATPLHLASSWYDSYCYSSEFSSVGDTMRLLIAHGGVVTAPDMSHSTPLHFASFSGISKIVLILIENGADVNARNETHSTPLHWASSLGCPEIVRLLIEHGADVRAKDWRHSTPLRRALSLDIDIRLQHGNLEHDKKVETARLLIEHGADVTAQTKAHSTPLHVAAYYMSAEIVRLLIEHGADVNARDETHRTPLHLEARLSRAETVQSLIEHGADVNVVMDGGHSTPLHLALNWQPEDDFMKIKTVRLLVEHGADVTAQDEDYSTPLHMAILVHSESSAEKVKLLIERGADVTAQDKNNKTPLHLASSWSHMDSDRRSYQTVCNAKADIALLLIRHGAGVSVQDKTLSTPLHLSAFYGYPETVRLLLEHGANVTTLDGGRRTPLHSASSWVYSRLSEPTPQRTIAKVEIVRLLIKHGMDVSARDENHSTPLHLASSSGIPEIVRLLIEHGADVTAQDGNCRTPMHLAPSLGDFSHEVFYQPVAMAKTDTVMLLIDHGADVNVRDETHSTPLHLASSFGNEETVQLLLEHGADVTIRDRSCRSPLHLALTWAGDIRSYDEWSTQRKARIASQLIKYGADVSAQDDSHSTPLHLASVLGIPWIIELLIKHGADVTAQDRENRTPLHLASSSGDAETVRILIDYGADVTAQDRGHRTPLHMASSWDDTDDYFDHSLREKPLRKAETMRLLIDNGADVTAQDESHSTPLHLASSLGSSESVRLLIEYGADVTAKDVIHRTPLHLASSLDEGPDERYQDLIREARLENKADTIQLLIWHGADVTTQDNTHSTPLHMASSNGSAETVDLLIQQGADVNAQNRNQSTPLHLAASSHLALKGTIVRLLLRHGANVDAKDGEGRTPLEIALSEGNSWIAKLILDHLASRG